MELPVLDLNNSQNWKMAFNQERVATTTVTGLLIAIPAFELITPFTEHILAVRCTSKTAKPHWRFAGNLIQRVSLGLGIPTADGTTVRMPLNRVMLIRFPHLSNEYELNFIPAYWLTQIRLTVWKYTDVEELY
ncbi:hypothetical protein [Scytonema sp. PRP1]|uniref:hypothetical protein n=1 Tax=Scytonema sp. PRP1 TaxID=3120513 RepID=UPI00300CCBDB